MNMVELDKNIFFVEGGNRGRYFFSNSLLIKDEQSLLIDTGTGTEVTERIAAEHKVDLVLITHGHEDHICGNDYFKEATVCSHELDAPAIRFVDKLTELYNVKGTELEDSMSSFLRDIFGLKDFRVDRELKDGDIIDTGSHRVEVIHTPGHSGGHCCFFIPDIKLVFLGDIDLSSFGPWYGCRDSHIGDFIKSVQRIKELDCETAVSSHKGVIQGKREIDEKLDLYLNKIFEREEKILSLLKEDKDLDGIVDEAVIYGKFPEPREMYRLMEKTMVEKHLEKLDDEGYPPSP